MRMISRIKHELLEVVSPVLFFFVAFNVITFTKKLMLEQYHIEFSGFISATVGALIVGKVVLIADEIPFINKYPDKPLIYNVVWKTVIYILVAFLVRFLEFLLPLWWKYRDLNVAVERLLAEVIWPHFLQFSSGLFCLFFVYVSFRELARTLGKKNFSKSSWESEGQRALTKIEEVGGGLEVWVQKNGMLKRRSWLPARFIQALQNVQKV
ncbi:MAG: hypothetical protein M1438_09105 [Deltaproteobacteria bacterium]|nr:hypothetical protein [Deltaproteobacteria bacterium]